MSQIWYSFKGFNLIHFQAAYGYLQRFNLVKSSCYLFNFGGGGLGDSFWGGSTCGSDYRNQLRSNCDRRDSLRSATRRQILYLKEIWLRFLWTKVTFLRCKASEEYGGATQSTSQISVFDPWIHESWLHEYWWNQI